MAGNKGGDGNNGGLDGGKGTDGGKFISGGGVVSITTALYVIIATFVLSKILGLSSRISTIPSSPKISSLLISFKPKSSDAVLTCIFILFTSIISI
jgi:hypothetical protein